MAKKQRLAHELPQRVKNDLSQNAHSNEMFCSIRHSVNIGDLWAAMGAIKKYYDITKRKVVLYQQINLPANYYPNAVHPTTNDGIMVTMNEIMFEMCKPMVESQEYIHSFEKYQGQNIDIDFDTIRQKTFVNLPNGMIQWWIPLGYPDLSFDISKAWIDINEEDCPQKIKDQVKGKIILNFTERYRNTLIDYFFLKHYMPDLIFAGTEREHWLFCNRWQLTIPRLEIDNFLELGYALKTARFSLSNQSQLQNLAEALKTPRILELCQFAENCPIMVGEYSEGYFHQAGVEYYFRTFYNRLK